MPTEVMAAPGSAYQPPGWPAGTYTTSTYDALDRPASVLYPDGNDVRNFYNYLQTAVIDESDHQTISVVDGFGRTVSVKQYEGSYASGPNWAATVYGEAKYEYDVLDRLDKATLPDNTAIDPTYNLLGWKTSLNDPDMGAWSYGYDADGNLTRQTDARGVTLCYEYDALNRLRYVREDQTSPKDCVGALALRTTHTYDAFDGVNQFGKGRRTGMSDGSGSTSWQYDQRGRVTKETKVISGTSFVTQWTYDAADRVQTMVYPSPGAETVTYTYNPQGLLTSLTTSLSSSIKYVESSTYDAASRLVQRAMRNSSTVAWTTSYGYYPWDAANGQGRLQNITISGSLQNLSYTYDAVGNVRSIVDGSNSSQKQCFNYDELNRLKQGYTGIADCTVYASGGNGPFEEQYTYFANGNPDHKKIVAPAYQDDAYLYAAPVSGCTAGTPATKPHAVRQAGSNTYSYDCNGNMIGRSVGGTSYTLNYDAENRLTGVSGGVSASFVYDGDGNRVKVTVGGVATLYPGRHYEYANSTTYTKYYHAGGDLVAFERSSGYGSTAGYGRRFVFRDHLNSTSLIVNGSNSTISKELYRPYSDVRYQWRSGTTALQTTYRYTGQRMEVGVGAPSPVGGLDRGLYFYRGQVVRCVAGPLRAGGYDCAGAR